VKEDGTVSNLDTREIQAENKAAASQADGTLPTHTVLQERYEIMGVQGVGGMGAVYRARDLRFSAVAKIVAVKEMNNVVADPRLRHIGIQNFEREANILASLSHPAIPKIFDYFSESSRSYLILEFIEGQNLESLLSERRRPYSQEEVVDWALQVCDVLAYLHGHSPPVIFRDMKPVNLMLRHDGRIMVIDFGIAKVFEHGQRGTMIGTEGYSPPEQYRGVAEPRGDLYALGATIHHLLTARDPRLEPPFTFQERPIRLFNQDVSTELETVVMKALAYEADDRFGTAGEMAVALNNAVPRSVRLTGGLGTTGLGGGMLRDQEITPKWTFRCEDEVRSSPRVADGVIYVGCYDNNLYALDAKEGTFLWKFPTKEGIAASPCIFEETVLIGSEDANLYAVSRRTGHEVWVCETQGRIRSSACVEYGHAFFGSDDGYLYVVNAQSGRVVWQFQSGGPIRSSPMVIDERVVFGSDDGYVYALDMRTGGVKWKYNTGRRVTSSPANEGTLVLIGSADGHLYGINGRSGWPVWRLRTGGYVLSSPTILGEMAYVGSTDGHLYAADAATGRQRWKYDLAGPITSSPTCAGDAVYIGSNDGAIHCVDARKGHGLWRYVTQGPVPSSPLVHDGIVYVGSTDHRVYALPT
jgi:outer membrane protein assembly factor BamB/tRNA A-37 threonylcarbamoyl transferase component Bud32